MQVDRKTKMNYFTWMKISFPKCKSDSLQLFPGMSLCWQPEMPNWIQTRVRSNLQLWETVQKSSCPKMHTIKGNILFITWIVIHQSFISKEKKCRKVPEKKCEKVFLDKCKELPKKVGEKVLKKRCVWPKKRLQDDTSC